MCDVRALLVCKVQNCYLHKLNAHELREITLEYLSKLKHTYFTIYTSLYTLLINIFYIWKSI